MDQDHDRRVLEEELIQNQSTKLHTGDNSVDLHGNPVLKGKTGRWGACFFILGTECCERLAFYGISMNIITYLSNKLHEGNVSAATNTATWKGSCALTPLVGAFVADTYCGRFRTIAVFSTIYFLGMCILTLSASLPALKPAECIGSTCSSAAPVQYIIFYFGLYLVALGTGGIKPCVSPFGADQFDDTDPKERTMKGSFFNWFYLSINIGALVSSTLLVWIQDNKGWGIGFAIPTFFMGIAIASFFFGTSCYRYQKPSGSPITRLLQVLVASFVKRNAQLPKESYLLHEIPDEISGFEGSRKLEHSDELKFLDRAAVICDADIRSVNFSNPWKLCTVTQVEELKLLIRMIPIWVTFIVFSAGYATSGVFIEQGMMMEKNVGSFVIPPASLSTFNIISVMFLIPVYDKVLVPLARRFTRNERGFSELQRIGIGFFIAGLALSAAALIEMKRLQIARDLGLVYVDVPVPLSILWQIPQNLLFGAAEVFTLIGQLEFFYNQSPDSMRSLCSALALLSSSLGSYLNAFILTTVNYFTAWNGSAGWIPNNLNEGHLDYFFWLFTAIGFGNLIVFVFCAKLYKYKKAT